MIIEPQKILAYQWKILNRWQDNARDFPWRSDPNPYAVIVSETMLQQTQAERVVSKFIQFMNEVPTIQDLAVLERKDLLRLWSWLGFNSRAMRLQQTAQRIIDEYNGKVPYDRQVLRSLPWIGAYSSASIPAFAYNLPEPVVDTNIRRVMIYELWVSEQLKSKQLEIIALQCIPEWQSREWHNALMDYGAIVATAKATGIKSLGKQSKFEWSRRQVRGNILKRLTKYGKTSIETLRVRFAHDAFESVVEELIDQEMISRENDEVYV